MQSAENVAKVNYFIFMLFLGVKIRDQSKECEDIGIADGERAIHELRNGELAHAGKLVLSLQEQEEKDYSILL